MYILWLVRPYVDAEGSEEVEYLNLHLSYDSYYEAEKNQKILEQVYGEGSIDIDTAQDYRARMGRY